MRLAKIASAVAGAAALALVCPAAAAAARHRVVQRARSAGASSAIASATSQAGSALSSDGSAVSAVGSARARPTLRGARRRGRRLAGADNAEDGKLIVGIKFDQPGLGLKNPDGTFSGFDVEVAKYVAEQLGVPEDGIDVQGGQVRRARGPDRARRGRLHRRHLLDHRHPQGEGQLRRPVLRRGTRTCWSSPTTPTSPGRTAMAGKILCSVTGSTSAQKVKDNYAADVALQEYGTYTECVEALKSGAVDAVTTDDVILAGYAAQSPGELKVVGEGFSDRELRHRPEEGRRRRHRRDQRRHRRDDRRRQLGDGAGGRPSGRPASRSRRRRPRQPRQLTEERPPGSAPRGPFRRPCSRDPRDRSPADAQSRPAGSDVRRGGPSGLQFPVRSRGTTSSARSG